MKIRLYPSLQFGWDLPQFQAVAREYLKEEPEEKVVIPKSENIGTNLGDLFKNLKIQ